MTTCTIYYPGLLGPDVPLEELPRGEWPVASELPRLAQLLNRAQLQSLRHCSIEARMLYGMGIGFAAEQDVPVAVLRATQMPQVDTAQALWCLDPVCIRLDQDQAVLLGNDMLELSEAEAHHLIDDLNAHLAQDGLHIHYLSPRQWVLQGRFDLTTSTPGDALLGNVNKYQPQGNDAARWRRLLNELQMLLHAHPINQQREQRGELPVNSVWLWGGGGEYSHEKIVTQVYSDEPLVHDVALVCDIAHDHLPGAIEPAILRTGQTLFVYTEQLRTIKSRDVYGWFDSLRYLEQYVLGPPLEMLRTGKLDSLTMYSDTLSLTLTRKLLTRWWRRTRPLDVQLKTLRHEFGIWR